VTLCSLKYFIRVCLLCNSACNFCSSCDFTRRARFFAMHSLGFLVWEKLFTTHFFPFLYCRFCIFLYNKCVDVFYAMWMVVWIVLRGSIGSCIVSLFAAAFLVGHVIWLDWRLIFLRIVVIYFEIKFFGLVYRFSYVFFIPRTCQNSMFLVVIVVTITILVL
jgi:hypothetical protein